MYSSSLTELAWVGKLKTKDAFSLQKNTFKKQDKFDLLHVYQPEAPW